MEFQLKNTDPESGARAGLLRTARGEIRTPVFMPVGTVGSVRGVQQRTMLEVLDAEIILANAYHLYLRPGLDVLRELGGLHRFMGWDRPILTDSGGYQIFSLAGRRTLSEEGVEFQSHIDGSFHFFSPESIVDTQRTIGSDVMMVLDECPAADVSDTYARESLELTMRWAVRCLDRFRTTEPLYGFQQALFGIVQGVVNPALRRESAERLVELGFDGYAIGGLSVGEPAPQMYEMVEVVNQVLPEDRPRYLMGVGTPVNLLENIARGVDMFDCVIPTRNGRNGMIYTTEGIINIKNKKWEVDGSPIDPGLPYSSTAATSRAYLRHLFQANEILGLVIASIQNLSFYVWLMREARAAIQEGRFSAWRDEMIPRIGRRL